jgi:hypothetical protein
MTPLDSDRDVNITEEDDDWVPILEFPLMVCPINSEFEDISDLVDTNGTVVNEQVDGLLSEQAEEIAAAVNNYHILREAVEKFLLTTPFQLGASEGSETGKVEWVAMARTAMNDLINTFMNEA